MNIAVILIITLLIFLALYFVGTKLFSEEKQTKRRIDDLAATDDNFTQTVEAMEEDEEKSGLAKVFDGIGRSVGIDIEAKEEQYGSKLYRAGITSATGRSIYIFFKYFGWIVGAVLFFLVYSSLSGGGATYWVSLLLTLFICCFVAFGADLYVNNLIEKRQQVLIRSFPDCLDLLLVCVESGLALDAALARVCKELKYAHPEITKEFDKTRIELTLLNDREKALQNLIDRTDLTAFKSLVAALLQSEKFGTSLVDTLRVLSDDYRRTRMAIAEEKAGRLPAMMTIPLICFMLPALLTLIMSPAIIKLLGVTE